MPGGLFGAGAGLVESVEGAETSPTIASQHAIRGACCFRRRIPCACKLGGRRLRASHRTKRIPHMFYSVAQLTRSWIILLVE